MHTIRTVTIGILFLFANFLGLHLYGQPSVVENYPAVPHVTEMRRQLISIANSQVGIRELTGRNDGKQIESYQKAVGIPKGSAWCVAFVVWCHLQISEDFPIPLTGWSPSMFTRNLVYHQNHVRLTKWEPRGGEVFGIFFTRLRRVAHVGIIVSRQAQHYETIEGNTSLMGAVLKAVNVSQETIDKLQRDGIWVARKLRSPDDIYVAADYIGGDEIINHKNIHNEL